MCLKNQILCFPFPFTTPSLMPAFQWQQSPGSISPVRLNLCLCKCIRANCYIMTSWDQKWRHMYEMLSKEKGELVFSPTGLKCYRKIKWSPKLQMLPQHLEQWYNLEYFPDKSKQIRAYIFMLEGAMPLAKILQKIKGVKITLSLDVPSSQSPCRILFIT